ncbi:histidine kinase [Actinomycetospora sp. OC33-EN08]|uniref:histidine kinase n=1 Tax=Actinomycetospora aurantiaca TaxID=3129233 RepID=A0ABU8ML68_9PSEU
MAPPTRRDVLVGLGAGLAALGATPLTTGRWPDAIGIALIALGAVALVWRRRAPVTVLVAVVLPVAVYYWLAQPDGPAGFLVAVAIYTVASRTGRTRAIGIGAVLVVTWAGLSLWLWDGPGLPPADGYLWIVGTVACGIAVGAVREVAAQRAEDDLRRRVEAERLRIARDVHDIVSHSLSMIAVQAGVGAHVAERRPDEAAAALRAIGAASSSALTELRATLRVLRDGDAATPAPAGIDDVVRVATLAGLTVRCTGEPIGDPAVDGAIARIVREAVTNVVRHAPDATDVEVGIDRHDDGSVRVRVADDGTPVPPPRAGQGLRGLAELAAGHGGSLHWEPTADGFVVEATLSAGATR